MSDFHSSASQISTYELCPRKWAWKYLDKVPDKPNKWAQLGTDIHSRLEEWLGGGVVPSSATPDGKVASVMIPHLPPPQAVNAENVEIKLGVLLGGIVFHGYIDLWMPSWKGVEGWVPRVYDHKSTSGLEWALTPENMPKDIQATIYAAWALMKTNAHEVSLQWTYGLTQGKAKAMPVIQTVTGKQISERLQRTIESAKETKLLKLSKVRAKDVPYDAAGCEAFGGCGYKTLCNLSPAERINSIMTQGNTKQDFLAKLQANKGKNGAPVTTTTAAASKPAAGESVVTGVINTAGAEVAPAEAPKARKGRKQVVAAPPEPAAAASEPAKGKKRRGFGAAPEAPPEPEAPTTPAESPKGAEKRRGFGAAPEAPPEPEAPAAPAESPKGAKKRRGFGAEAPPDAPPSVADTSVPAETPAEPKAKKRRSLGASTETTSTEEASTSAKVGDWTLYIDCAPIKGVVPYEDAASRIQYVLDAISKEFGTPHYRLLDFGKGAGIFATAVLRDLQERPPVQGAIVIWTKSNEARDCLQSFMASAGKVISG